MYYTCAFTVYMLRKEFSGFKQKVCLEHWVIFYWKRFSTKNNFFVPVICP